MKKQYVSLLLCDAETHYNCELKTADDICHIFLRDQPGVNSERRVVTVGFCTKKEEVQPKKKLSLSVTSHGKTVWLRGRNAVCNPNDARTHASFMLGSTAR